VWAISRPGPKLNFEKSFWPHRPTAKLADLYSFLAHKPQLCSSLSKFQVNVPGKKGNDYLKWNYDSILHNGRNLITVSLKRTNESGRLVNLIAEHCPLIQYESFVFLEVFVFFTLERRSIPKTHKTLPWRLGKPCCRSIVIIQAPPLTLYRMIHIPSFLKLSLHIRRLCLWEEFTTEIEERAGPELISAISQCSQLEVLQFNPSSFPVVV